MIQKISKPATIKEILSKGRCSSVEKWFMNLSHMGMIALQVTKNLGYWIKERAKKISKDGMN